MFSCFHFLYLFRFISRGVKNRTNNFFILFLCLLKIRPVTKSIGQKRYNLPAILYKNLAVFTVFHNVKYICILVFFSHFDGVRTLAFHPVEPVLITGSEDHTLKLWNLQKTVPAKK